MVDHHQCYFLDSGMIFRQRRIEDWVPPDPWPEGYVPTEPVPEDFVPPDPLPEGYISPPPWVPYQNRSWFDPAVHSVATAIGAFPEDWERRPYFYIPALGVIEDNVGDHPLIKVLKSQFPNGDNWELLEDKIEAAGGLRRAIEHMDIGRLGRRIKRMYLDGEVTTDEVQKIKAVFQHLTTDFD